MRFYVADLTEERDIQTLALEAAVMVNKTEIRDELFGPKNDFQAWEL